jgi:hypothetical protein
MIATQCVMLGAVVHLLLWLFLGRTYAGKQIAERLLLVSVVTYFSCALVAWSHLILTRALSADQKRQWRRRFFVGFGQPEVKYFSTQGHDRPGNR